MANSTRKGLFWYLMAASLLVAPPAQAIGGTPEASVVVSIHAFDRQGYARFGDDALDTDVFAGAHLHLAELDTFLHSYDRDNSFGSYTSMGTGMVPLTSAVTIRLSNGNAQIDPSISTRHVY